MELVIYLIIAIIWAIVSLIQKAVKGNKNTKNKSKTYTQKTKKVNSSNEEEIFKKLQKNIKDLKNLNEETLRKNVKDENVYTSSYTTSSNDKEILELQEKYNSKIAQINNIKNDTGSDIYINPVTENNNKYVNNMLSSLDIKNAIIYNAILEPKRINYSRIKNSKIN